MKVYVASGVENARRVRRTVMKWLVEMGHEVTYDWTNHGSVAREPVEVARRVAQEELDGVAAADLVLVLLPGGKGTHVELGLAVALKKRVAVVMSIDDWANPNKFCVFYRLPGLHVEKLSTKQLSRPRLVKILEAINADVHV